MFPKGTGFKICVKVREDSRSKSRRMFGQMVSKRNSKSSRGNTQRRKKSCRSSKGKQRNRGVNCASINRARNPKKSTGNCCAMMTPRE